MPSTFVESYTHTIIPMHLSNRRRRTLITGSLSSLLLLLTSPGAVTPGGTLGDNAAFIEVTGGESPARASGVGGLGAALVHDFDTTVFADASYELTAPSTIALSSGRHLVLYDTRFDRVGGSNRSEFLSYLTLNGSPLAIGRSQGFLRRLSGNDEAIMSGGGIITVAADDQLLTLSTQRSDSNPNAGTGTTVRAANGTAIQLLKLDDSWDFLSASRSSNQSGTVGTTAVDVVYDTLEADSSLGSAFTFTAGSGDVTLNETGNYLLFANTRLEKPNDGTRTNFQQFLTLDGSEVAGTRTTTYMRGNANGEGANSGVAAIGTILAAAAGQTLNVEVVKEAGGVNSTIRGSETALTIIKLPPTVKTIALGDSTSQEVNPGSETAMTFDLVNASSSDFGHTAGTSAITANTDDDYLFFGSVFTSSDATNDNQDRIVPHHGWQIDGAGGRILRGRGGAYNRDNGNARTSGSWNGAIIPLTSGQTVEMTSQAFAGTETGAASTVYLSALSIASLSPSADPAVATNLPIEIVPNGTSTITTEYLETFDANTAVSGLTYTITSDPVGGTLSSTVNGALGNGSTFTQAQIDNNEIQFTGGASATTGGFDFTVSDGNASESGSFVIEVKYPDATITIASNGNVSEGATASWTITSSAAPTGSDLVIGITYSGTASDGSDFSGVTSVSITPGNTSVDVDFSVVDDGLYEGCESIIASIGTLSGGELSASAGTSTNNVVEVEDGSNSNPVFDTTSNIFSGSGTIALSGLSTLDPDTGYQSAISSSSTPHYTFNGANDVTIFGDARAQDDSSFDIDGTGPALNAGAGFSMDIEFSVAESDLSGSVLVWEIGGSSNGTALLLIEGIPHLLVKAGGGPGDVPTNDNTVAGAFNDLNWAGDDTIVVPLGATALQPGAPARIALIFSDANDTVEYSTNGADSATVTLLNNDANNWRGDHTVNFGRNAGTGIGGNTNVAGTPFTDLEILNLSGGPSAIACSRFWNESTGSLTTSAAGDLDEVTLTLTIDGWVAGAGDLTANSGNGETYANGVWSITADAISASAALASVEFVSGASTADPTRINVSLEEGNEDGGNALTTALFIVSTTPDPLYVDDDFSGLSFGALIADSDTGAPIVAGTFGLDSFATIADAIANVAVGGTIIVNDGDYSSENIALTNEVTLQLTGTGSSTISINQVTGTDTTSLTSTIDLADETLIIGDNDGAGAFDGGIIGSGDIVKNGSGRWVVRNSMTYTGTTTVNAGQLRLGYDSVKGNVGNWDGDGAIVVNAPGALEFNAGGGMTQTQTGVISGDGSVSKLDNGYLVFDGASGNTFTGIFYLGDGTTSNYNGVDQGNSEGFVVVNHNDHLGAGLVLSKGAQLQAGTAGLVIPNEIQITGGGFRCGGTIGYELSGDIATIDNQTRGFGNYGLEGCDLVISGNVDNSGGQINFEGSNGRDNGTWTVTGDISGPFPVLLQNTFDDGVVTLSGTNTYTGATTVTTGTLVFDGTHTGGADYNVTAGTLAGSGSTESALTVGAAATLSPGNGGVGTLSVGNLTLDGTLAIDVTNTTGAAGIDWDQVNVTGTVTISDTTSALSVSQSDTVEDPPNTITIIASSDTDGLPGTFSGGDYNVEFLGSGLLLETSSDGGDGNDIVLSPGAQNTIGAWRFANFGSSANLGNGANDSDAGDSDGISNFLEFAFGTNPNVSDQAQLALDGSSNGTPTVTVDFSGDGVDFTGVFVRRDDAGQSGSLSYTAQFSSDLATWFDSSDTPTVVADSAANTDYEVVEVAYPFFTPDGKKARYFRVLVESVE